MFNISVNVPASQEGKKFLLFLRRAAKKHSVQIGILRESRGEFRCSIPSGENFSLFLQELMLNRGLYYYLCSVPNPRKVARLVVRPIFEELLENCFAATNRSLLRKQLQGGPHWMVAGEFMDSTAQEFEILWHRLKLNMISGYEFIRDLDDLLTQFMLYQLSYASGQRSPKFNVLVDQCGKKNVLRCKEHRKIFNEIHSLRTRGLHRQERKIPNSELSRIAIQSWNFFQYLDDYWEAQNTRTVRLRGKLYRRVRYGKEIPHWRKHEPNVPDRDFEEFLSGPCHDCGCIRGELHLDGCDLEVCPRCSRQFLGCECNGDDDEGSK